MKFSSFAPILQTLMTDKLTVYRYEKGINDDGSTSNQLQVTKVYDREKCRLSFTKLESAKDAQVDEVPVKSMPMLFCKSSLNLLAGDKVLVERMQDDGSVLQIYKGTIGKPVAYETHLEVALSEKGSA